MMGIVGERVDLGKQRDMWIEFKTKLQAAMDGLQEQSNQVQPVTGPVIELVA